jgi:hypothetical protein
MTNEQLQSIIDHKVKEATAPLERRWEMLRTFIERWKTETEDWQGKTAYASVIWAMDYLCKPENETEPRRKLPTDPRRKNKLDK